MESVNTLPDERAFVADVDDGPFLLGVHTGRWQLGQISWPLVNIAVNAAERPPAPTEWWFRFDCAGYPDRPPTARLWDAQADQPLPVARWPGGASRVPAVFRPDWKDGTCLYLPCDRISISGHEAWPVEHPHLMWDPRRGIVLYLEEIHSLLHSSDYQGVRNG